jgi:hypothetical protein
VTVALFDAEPEGLPELEGEPVVETVIDADGEPESDDVLVVDADRVLEVVTDAEGEPVVDV